MSHWLALQRILRAAAHHLPLLPPSQIISNEHIIPVCCHAFILMRMQKCTNNRVEAIFSIFLRSDPTEMCGVFFD